MARTQSKMISLGSKAPEFLLPEVRTSDRIGLYDVLGDKALLVMFLSKHCPYVQRIAGQIKPLSEDYIPKGIRMIGISSNDPVAYPEDSPEEMAKLASELDWRFPLLFDSTQEVAKAFHAACTPDFFLFDHKGALVYRGQMDDARPHNDEPNNGHSLRSAFDAILAAQPIPAPQLPSLGCSIKWK
ncbi:MAG: thioredoxin family protein [Bdellovibrionota bacterium]